MHVGAASDQLRHDRRVPFLCGNMQRRPPAHKANAAAAHNGPRTLTYARRFTLTQTYRSMLTHAQRHIPAAKSAADMRKTVQGRARDAARSGLAVAVREEREVNVAGQNE